MSYIFGGSTGETPESIKRKRALASALLSKSPGSPRNLGQGLHSFGAQIGAALLARQADKRQKEGTQRASEVFDALIKRRAPRAEPLKPEMQQSPLPPPDPMRDGIVSTAQSLGIDPVDLATAISYETGGTFDPEQAGPTTQWGQHKGLIQFGEPQAKQHGVDWNDPLGSQLGPNGAIASYLRSTGVKPGMGLEDIYSAINAGAVGRSNATDAHNGGAPGTVADKVASMGNHRAKAQALIGEMQVPSVPSPQQTSAQPAIDPALLSAMANPFMSRQQQTVMGALLQQQMQQPEGMTPYQQAQLGLAERRLQAQLDGKISNAPTVNINQQGDNQWAKESAKGTATMLTGMAEAGVQAQGELGQIGELQSLLTEHGIGGTSDAWKAWAQNRLGVNIGAGGALEAFSALVNKLVPLQRPPGSGQMSDRDVQLFKESLPQLINSPEGNQIILETMKGMAQFKRQQGEIAQQAMIGRITREDALQQLYQLPDPLAGFRERREKMRAKPATGGLPPLPDGIGITEEEWPAIWEAMTPEERALWQN